jgi:hypothetical protein
MTHAKMAPFTGLAMGTLIPAMIHGPLAAAGLAFVAAHLLLALALLSAILFYPAVRARIARHRPTPRMVRRIGLGAAAGFALVCLHCLVTWHASAPWT